MASSALSPEQFSSLPDLIPGKGNKGGNKGALQAGRKASTAFGGIPTPGGGGGGAPVGGGSGGLIDAAADANGVFKITSLAAAL